MLYLKNITSSNGKKTHDQNHKTTFQTVAIHMCLSTENGISKWNPKTHLSNQETMNITY